MNNKRNLRPEEIAILQANACKADNWRSVFVPDFFDIQHVTHTHFSGEVSLGAFNKEFVLPGGLTKHAGLHNVTLHNCSLGDNCLIENVQNYIANYTIGDNCIIQHINVMLVDGCSSFGNGTPVAVLNETGGREVPMYNNLSAPLAYIIALYRHRPELINQISQLIEEYSKSISSSFGTIGNNTRITNTGTIRNVHIGSNATIENCTRLENGSVNSRPEEPVYVGDSVIAQDFILSPGVVLADAAKLIRCFVGQACHITHNFSAHDSLLFSNCVFENGEACAIFAGPFTVSMHKSSLLIAGMYSFLNAGSGSNQSNHMYKLGPIHQGIVERGSKTTSDSYLLWPARVGAFSLVMGRHYRHCDTSDMPFSYLIEKDDETYLVPGVNLRSVGTIRDAQKWPKRDKRKPDLQLDPINYNLLSPYTISKMIKAVEVLKNLQSLVGETSEIYYYQNTRIKGSSLRKGLDLYNKAINKFLGNSLIKRLEATNYSSIEEVWKQLCPTEIQGKGEWIDLSGMIVPKEVIEEYLCRIEAGEIHSLDEIAAYFHGLHKKYYDMEWTWTYGVIESFYDVNLQTINAEKLISLVEIWKESVVSLDELLYADAKKEFSLTSKISFGVDGSTSDKMKDFEGVRGDFENNPFVTAVKEHIVTKKALGDELINRLNVVV